MIRSANPPRQETGGSNVGRRAEDLACRHLGEHGLELLQRNYRCNSGEIDLVMQDGACIVFVEVRFRRNTRFGGALESIDRRKQGRLIRTAQHYLQTQDETRWAASRFDVVCVSPGGETPDLEWIRDAFQA